MRTVCDNTKQIMESVLKIVAAEEELRKWLEEARTMNTREKTKKRKLERLERENQAKMLKAASNPYELRSSQESNLGELI
jgi:hypothetical protein